MGLHNKLEIRCYFCFFKHRKLESLWLSYFGEAKPKNGKYSILEKLVHRLLEVLVHIVHMWLLWLGWLFFSFISDCADCFLVQSKYSNCVIDFLVQSKYSNCVIVFLLQSKYSNCCDCFFGPRQVHMIKDFWFRGNWKGLHNLRGG